MLNALRRYNSNDITRILCIFRLSPKYIIWKEKFVLTSFVEKCRILKICIDNFLNIMYHGYKPSSYIHLSVISKLRMFDNGKTFESWLRKTIGAKFIRNMLASYRILLPIKKLEEECDLDECKQCYLDVIIDDLTFRQDLMYKATNRIESYGDPFVF